MQVSEWRIPQCLRNSGWSGRVKNRSVLVRPPNDELRSREYLTVAEVERLMKAAQHGRYDHRDATLILVAFRHGLRAAEICDLEWSQVNSAARPRCMSAASRMASRASIRCGATRSGHSAGNSRIVASSSRPSGAARSHQTPSIGRLSALATVPASPKEAAAVFSDLVGSRVLSARMDPEDLREVISAYQSVAETVQRFGGFVAKYIVLRLSPSTRTPSPMRGRRRGPPWPTRGQKPSEATGAAGSAIENSALGLSLTK